MFLLFVQESASLHASYMFGIHFGVIHVIEGKLTLFGGVCWPLGLLANYRFANVNYLIACLDTFDKLGLRDV